MLIHIGQKNQDNKNMSNYYKDNRGTIEMILESTSVGSVSLIKSNSGATRANHYHPVDTHYIYITTGDMEIYERPVGSNVKPIKQTLREGDLWFTNNGLEHTMYFLTDCDFWCFSKLPRNQKNYESETVRFNHDLRDTFNNWKD